MGVIPFVGKRGAKGCESQNAAGSRCIPSPGLPPPSGPPQHRSPDGGLPRVPHRGGGRRHAAALPRPVCAGIGLRGAGTGGPSLQPLSVRLFGASPVRRATRDVQPLPQTSPALSFLLANVPSWPPFSRTGTSSGWSSWRCRARPPPGGAVIWLCWAPPTSSWKTTCVSAGCLLPPCFVSRVWHARYSHVPHRPLSACLQCPHPVSDAEDITDPAHLLRLYQYRALRSLVVVALELQGKVDPTCCGGVAVWLEMKAATSLPAAASLGGCKNDKQLATIYCRHHARCLSPGFMQTV